MSGRLEPRQAALVASPPSSSNAPDGSSAERANIADYFAVDLAQTADEPAQATTADGPDAYWGVVRTRVARLANKFDDSQLSYTAGELIKVK